MRRYPTPARNPAVFRVLPSEESLTELSHGTGTLYVPFERNNLIGYLTTQSNIEECVKRGSTYAEIEQEIELSMPAWDHDDFLYEYSYTIVQYLRGDPMAVRST